MLKGSYQDLLNFQYEKSLFQNSEVTTIKKEGIHVRLIQTEENEKEVPQLKELLFWIVKIYQIIWNLRRVKNDIQLSKKNVPTLYAKYSPKS